jgi:Flp pilus assembly protein TadD
LFFLQSPEVALKEEETMTANTPSNRERAVQLLQETKYTESIPLLISAIDEEPIDVDLQIYLAYAYAQTGDAERSVEVLERAADIAPTSAKIHYNLGVAYQKAHNSTQAKDEYMRALGLDARYTQAKTALDSLMQGGATYSSDAPTSGE